MPSLTYDMMKHVQEEIARVVAAECPEVARHRSGGSTRGRGATAVGHVWVLVEAFATPVPVPTIRARWVQWENVKARITTALGPLVQSLPGCSSRASG